METILDLQQRCKTWFANYEIYLLPLIKFITMMAVLLTMNWHLGYRLALMRWVVVILASLVCSLLPWSGMTAIAALYLLGHVSALSWEAGVVLAAVMFAAVLAQYLFLPRYSILIVLTVLAFYFRIPYLVPLLAGLFGSGLTFLPVGIGVVIYYVCAGLEKNAMLLLDPSRSIPDSFLTVLDIFRSGRIIIVAVAAFCLCALAVYAISRLSADYARYISVAVGAVLMLVIYLLGDAVVDVPINYGALILGTVVSTLLAFLAVFWFGGLDYSRPEYLQYEDDEYVYYVKAVPKMVVETPQRKVQAINPKRVREEKPMTE